MKKGLTELVFVLDKSGSMGGLEGDTIGGYNSMLKKQKLIEGECVVTTVLFDHGFELLHDRIDIRAIQPMTEEEYQVGAQQRSLTPWAERFTRSAMFKRTQRKITGLSR